eukprot:CFRG7410T1
MPPHMKELELIYNIGKWMVLLKAYFLKPFPIPPKIATSDGILEVPIDLPEELSCLLSPNQNVDTKDDGGLPSPENCLFVNLLLLHGFLALRDTRKLRERFEAWIDKKITDLRKVLGDVTLVEYDLGSSSPFITNCQVTESVVGKYANRTTMYCDFLYTGRLSFILNITLPFGYKGTIRIEVQKVAGAARIQVCSPDPAASNVTERDANWSLSFLKDPILEFTITSSFKGAHIARITSLIEYQLKRSIHRKHTLPNYWPRYILKDRLQIIPAPSPFVTEKKNVMKSAVTSLGSAGSHSLGTLAVSVDCCLNLASMARRDALFRRRLYIVVLYGENRTRHRSQPVAIANDMALFDFHVAITLYAEHRNLYFEVFEKRRVSKDTRVATGQVNLTKVMAECSRLRNGQYYETTVSMDLDNALVTRSSPSDSLPPFNTTLPHTSGHGNVYGSDDAREDVSMSRSTSLSEPAINTSNTTKSSWRRVKSGNAPIASSKRFNKSGASFKRPHLQHNLHSLDSHQYSFPTTPTSSSFPPIPYTLPSTSMHSSVRTQAQTPTNKWTVSSGPSGSVNGIAGTVVGETNALSLSTNESLSNPDLKLSNGSEKETHAHAIYGGTTIRPELVCRFRLRKESTTSTEVPQSTSAVQHDSLTSKTGTDRSARLETDALRTPTQTPITVYRSTDTHIHTQKHTPPRLPSPRPKADTMNLVTRDKSAPNAQHTCSYIHGATNTYDSENGHESGENSREMWNADEKIRDWRKSRPGWTLKSHLMEKVCFGTEFACYLNFHCGNKCLSAARSRACAGSMDIAVDSEPSSNENRSFDVSTPLPFQMSEDSLPSPVAMDVLLGEETPTLVVDSGTWPKPQNSSTEESSLSELIKPVYETLQGAFAMHQRLWDLNIKLSRLQRTRIEEILTITYTSASTSTSRTTRLHTQTQSVLNPVPNPPVSVVLSAPSSTSTLSSTAIPKTPGAGLHDCECKLENIQTSPYSQSHSTREEDLLTSPLVPERKDEHSIKFVPSSPSHKHSPSQIHGAENTEATSVKRRSRLSLVFGLGKSKISTEETDWENSKPLDNTTASGTCMTAGECTGQVYV